MPAKAVKSKKTRVPSKAKALIDDLLEFLDTFHLGEKTYNKITAKIFNTIKVFIVATRKFMIDDCLTKASSIAYTVIISLIPTLTVILTIRAGSKKEEIFAKIQKFMLENNLKLNIDPIFNAISRLVENAAEIGGIGAAIMIFSATAMLRSMEKSFNSIWNVQKQRPIYLKIIYYWAALTLGPIMLVAGTSVAAKVTDALSSPDYKSAFINEKNSLWIVGSKSNILYSEKGGLNFKKLKLENIDFDNQKKFDYDYSIKGLKKSDELIEPIVFKKSNFNDIQFIGDEGWIAGKEGILLSTKNNGRSWQLKKIGDYNFNDIHMINKNRGFIASDNGRVFSTKDGGNNWEILEWKEINSDFNSIAFNNENGIICGSRGIILITRDSGATWDVKEIEAATKKSSFVNLNYAQYINSTTILIAATDGIILKSTDRGSTWKLNTFKQTDYYAAYFFNEKEGYAAGSDGKIIYTEDGGDTWKPKSMPTYRVNRILYKNKKLIAVGEDGMIMLSTDKGLKWEGKEGRNFLTLLINFFAPFIFIWLLFLLAYKTLPNIQVPFKEASIGAAFTGTVWVLFILLFIVYIKAFARSTFAIYGALAAIPLFLLMIYASSLIILYGAELAYTLMHPESYSSIKKIFQKKEDLQVFYGISILQYIYNKFEKGAGASKQKEILKVCSNRGEQAEFYVELFLDEKLIILNGENDYLPANNSANIKISDVIDLIHHISLSVPGSTKGNPLKSILEKLFTDIKKGRRKLVGNLTLKDLIEKG